jgi:hypothetical protein
MSHFCRHLSERLNTGSVSTVDISRPQIPDQGHCFQVWVVATNKLHSIGAPVYPKTSGPPN